MEIIQRDIKLKESAYCVRASTTERKRRFFPISSEYDNFSGLKKVSMNYSYMEYGRSFQFIKNYHIHEQMAYYHHEEIYLPGLLQSH